LIGGGGAGEKMAETAADLSAEKARKERLSLLMWGYICSAISLISLVIGWGASFFPIAFGIAGCWFAWKLNRLGERRRNLVPGVASLAGILIWITYNWSRAFGH
jgi:hypothetical protein